MLTFSRASVYALADFDRKISVPTIMKGSAASTTRPSCMLSTSSATRMPTNVNTLTAVVVSPVCRNVENASTSVVMRVMIRPDISFS